MEYQYFNPSPIARYKKDGTPMKHDRSDCVIRAICAATDMSWDDAFDLAFTVSKRVYDMPFGKNGLEEIMKNIGMRKVTYKRGEKRDTVCDLAIKYPDMICIANLSGHIVCCKNGHYYDTYQCGYKSAYNYWIKDPKQPIPDSYLEEYKQKREHTIE